MNEQQKIKILESIDLYIKGQLSQDEIDELWKTFLEHPEYYEWFETEVHLRSLIREGKRPQFNIAKEPVQKDDTATIYTFKRWLYAAAAAVIIALGLQFFALQQPDDIQSLAMTEIEQSNLIGADVLRTDEPTNEDINIAINSALAAAYEGETEEAIEQFEQILEETTHTQQHARVEMNLGILLYNSGQYESAENHFSAITEMENLPDYQLEKAWWFLGNTYLNINQPHEAREAVFQAYSLNGRFQSAALSLLKKLDLRLGNIPTEEEPESLGD